MSGCSLSIDDVSHRFSLLKPVLHFLQTHQLDYSAHYLRLKFLIENQIQFYVPKPEEDIYELVMLPTEQNEMTLGRTVLISVYLTFVIHRAMLFLTCSYSALQTIANWPTVK